MPPAPSLRGVGFAPALAAQKAYAEQGGPNPRFGLIAPQAFIRGIRDLGYRSNADAIAELIDNALQAYADRIDVLFGYGGTQSQKKPLQLAIVDNGHGMEPAMSRLAVMWGGTHRENDRSGLGRYGYGLPCSSVSLGRRFTVFSQVTGGHLYAVTIDLDDLASGAYTNVSGDVLVPEPRRAELPGFIAAHIDQAFPEGWPSGTVILVEKLDRLEWTTSLGLRDNLRRQFGVTYHKLRGEAAIFVDNAFVEPIDPLFLTPDFCLFNLDADRSHPFDPVRVEVRHPDSGAYLGAMTLRYAWLPPSFGSVDKDRDAVGLNANDRFSVMKDYHGIIFSRNGRLIDTQTRTPWTAFINNDRYIKVEIEFSATLDEMFGVTTSKQQVTVSAFIWDLLREAGLPKAIEQLRHKVKEAKFMRRLEALSPGPGRARASETAMKATAAEEHQGELLLTNSKRHAPPYEVVFEHRPTGPFFEIERDDGSQVLRINTSHRFYEDLYAGPCSTAAFRAALEVLLFCLGDVMLKSDHAPVGGRAQVLMWSTRLDLALGMLAAHLGTGEDQDIGQSA